MDKDWEVVDSSRMKVFTLLLQACKNSVHELKSNLPDEALGNPKHPISLVITELQEAVAVAQGDTEYIDVMILTKKEYNSLKNVSILQGIKDKDIRDGCNPDPFKYMAGSARGDATGEGWR